MKPSIHYFSSHSILSLRLFSLLSLPLACQREETSQNLRQSRILYLWHLEFHRKEGASMLHLSSFFFVGQIIMFYQENLPIQEDSNQTFQMFFSFSKGAKILYSHLPFFSRYKKLLLQLGFRLLGEFWI